MAIVPDSSIAQSKKLSPRRNSTQATNVAELVDEQLDHFGINPDDEYGQTLKRIDLSSPDELAVGLL